MPPPLPAPGTRKRTGGFTIIELMVVIGILAILSLTATSIMTGSRRMAYDVTARHDLDSFAKAVDAWLAAEGEYPCHAGDVLSGAQTVGSTMNLPSFAPSRGVVIRVTGTDPLTARSGHVEGRARYEYSSATGTIREI